jgi:hypothetical protein
MANNIIAKSMRLDPKIRKNREIIDNGKLKIFEPLYSVHNRIVAITPMKQKMNPGSPTNSSGLPMTWNWRIAIITSSA